MRQINWNNETVDYGCAAKLSENWDSKYPQIDTEYLIIDASVLGNAAGKKAVDNDDASSAWAAVHGRKYNNARIAIPFDREFVSEHYSEIAKITEEIAKKCTGTCSVIQRMMTNEEKEQGRETSMRTQAIREAKQEIMNSSGTIDEELFKEANASVRASAASKVEFNHGVSVSARRIHDTDGLNDKKQFKRKTVTIGDAPTVGYVVTMNEAGLKKVPVMNQKMREAAEDSVMRFAKVVVEEVSKIADDPDSVKSLNAIKAIRDKMPGDPKLAIEVAPFSTDELNKIAMWKEEVLNNYRS